MVAGPVTLIEVNWAKTIVHWPLARCGLKPLSNGSGPTAGPMVGGPTRIIVRWSVRPRGPTQMSKQMKSVPTGAGRILRRADADVKTGENLSRHEPVESAGSRLESQNR